MLRTSLLSIAATFAICSICSCTGHVVNLGDGEGGTEGSSGKPAGAGGSNSVSAGEPDEAGATSSSSGAGGSSSGGVVEDAGVVEEEAGSVGFADGGSSSVMADSGPPACACSAGYACVITASPGSPCVSPSDAGVCPPDTLADGPSCCFVSLSFGCQPTPSSCGSELTCECAGAKLCGSGCKCTAASGSDLECECP
jgi:hypothetical protein